MPKTTGPLTYRYDVDGHQVDVTRRHIGTAYPNGNVHNPTEYFVWSAKADGVPVHGHVSSRSVAYEYARAKVLGIRYAYDDRRGGRCVNVRPFTVVAREMRANYRGRA